MGPRPVNPDLPDGVSESEREQLARAGRDRASLDSSTRSSESEQSQRIDTTTFSPSTVTQHYTSHIGGIHASTTPPPPASRPSAGSDSRRRGDDVFNLARHYQSTTVPSARPHNTPFTTKDFFQQTEQYKVDQSINFMDHNRANYTPPPARQKAPPRSARSTGSSRGTSFVDSFLNRRGESNRDSRRTGSASRTRSTSSNPNTMRESDEKYSVVPRAVSWLLIFISFGLGATFLALSVPHLARHSMEDRANARKDASRKRWAEMKASLLATGLTLQSDLENQNSSQHYAFKWLSFADPAELEPNDPGLALRYALAVFFYSNHPEIADEHSDGKRRHLDSDWVHDDQWMTKSDVCRWYGIECGKTKNNQLDILEFNMTENQLGGTIPSEIVALSSLELLDLSFNGLSGTIPIQIFDMKYLKEFILKNNEFSGTLSPEIGYFYPAEEIDLSQNLLEGSIPMSIRTLVNLRRLSLRDNDLDGTLPDMSALLQLVSLDLDQNKFGGKIPAELSQLPKLAQISLEENNISGSIPASLSRLTDLETLRLGHNLLTGAIPDIFQNQNRLVEIRLQKNQLQKTLPASLGVLTNLKSIMMDSNELVGSIPDSWMDMHALESLILHKNDLTGTISSSIGNLKHLRDLWLNKNRIGGTVPTEMALLDNLNTLYLENNPLHGILPKEIGKLQSLKALRLDGTKLTGVVPEEVCTLKKTSELMFISASCNTLRCMCCDKCSYHKPVVTSIKSKDLTHPPSAAIATVESTRLIIIFKFLD